MASPGNIYMKIVITSAAPAFNISETRTWWHGPKHPFSYAVVWPLTAIYLRLDQPQVHCDGGQDTLLQNKAPWHIEYFKLKEFEKWQEQDSPTFPQSRSRPSHERCPPPRPVNAWRREASFSSRRRDVRGIGTNSPANCPQFLTTAHTLSCPVLPRLSTLLQTQPKSSQV